MSQNDVIPVVGMGATLCYPSDAYPYIITKVISDKAIEVCALDTNGTPFYIGKAQYRLDPSF